MRTGPVAAIAVALAVSVGTCAAQARRAAPAAAAPDSVPAARAPLALWPPPGFQWPLWPPPRRDAGLLATPVWPPPPPLVGDSSFVHPLWPPESGAPLALHDESLPPFGEHVWVDEMPRLLDTPTARTPAGGTGLMSRVVVVQTLVDRTGRVRATRVLSAEPPFAAAAEKAVRSYRFEPARRNGRPVAVWIAVPVHFSAQ